MEIFFLWLAGALILLSGYLSWLWWRPPFLFKKNAPSPLPSGRFQVRLTIFFLLFALVPAVPLIFLVSSLYTGSMQVLLMPQMQESLQLGLDAIKFQLEERARLFEQAARREPLTPELLAYWDIDFCLLWQRQNTQIQLLAIVGADLNSRQRGLAFGADQMSELWGQAGSQLKNSQRPMAPGDSAPVISCEVWLPHLSNAVQPNSPSSEIAEMLLISFPVDPELIKTKLKITEAARVYNTLALMKERFLRDKILWSGAALLVTLLSAFSVYAARRFSQTLSRPLEHLTATMGEAAGGNLAVRANVQARDEIGVLVHSFNQMIGDLQTSREQLLAAERLAAWREVARQVSHEIKNPLTALQMALFRVRQRFTALNAERQDAAVITESFQSIEAELAGLRHLAEEFSEFARLPKAAPAPEQLNEIIETTTRLYGAERLQIRLDLAPDLPARPLDREQIKRLLNNLLKNAVEAAPARRCEVKISTRQQNERVVLEIADNGPGLSAAARENLFKMNFTTKREGSGLGLVMVKRIVEEHGGAIAVESEEGRGTRFRIAL